MYDNFLDLGKYNKKKIVIPHIFKLKTKFSRLLRLREPRYRLGDLKG